MEVHTTSEPAAETPLLPDSQQHIHVHTPFEMEQEARHGDYDGAQAPHEATVPATYPGSGYPTGNFHNTKVVQKAGPASAKAPAYNLNATIPEPDFSTCYGVCGKVEGYTLRCYGSPTRRYFPFTCVIGPHWPLNMCLWGILLGPSIVFLSFVYVPDYHMYGKEFLSMNVMKSVFENACSSQEISGTTTTVIFIVAVCLILTAVIALARTSFGDPGYLPRLSPEEAEQLKRNLEEAGELKNYAFCKHCNQYRTPGTHHCYDCDRCCEELDHHCPWMGKDVGKYNLQSFYCFLWSFCASIIFGVITTFVIVL